jgi:hypothetical protein
MPLAIRFAGALYALTITGVPLSHVAITAYLGREIPLQPGSLGISA